MQMTDLSLDDVGELLAAIGDLRDAMNVIAAGGTGAPRLMLNPGGEAVIRVGWAMPGPAPIGRAPGDLVASSALPPELVPDAFHEVIADVAGSLQDVEVAAGAMPLEHLPIEGARPLEVHWRAATTEPALEPLPEPEAAAPAPSDPGPIAEPAPVEVPSPGGRRPVVPGDHAEILRLRAKGLGPKWIADHLGLAGQSVAGFMAGAKRRVVHEAVVEPAAADASPAPEPEPTLAPEPTPALAIPDDPDWSPEDDLQLAQLFEARDPLAVIADTLGREVGLLKARWAELNPTALRPAELGPLLAALEARAFA